MAHQKKKHPCGVLCLYPSRRLGISSRRSRGYHQGRRAALVSHHALACIFLRLDEMQCFASMICNSSRNWWYTRLRRDLVAGCKKHHIAARRCIIRRTSVSEGRYYAPFGLYRIFWQIKKFRAFWVFLHILFESFLHCSKIYLKISKKRRIAQWKEK